MYRDESLAERSARAAKLARRFSLTSMRLSASHLPQFALFSGRPSPTFFPLPDVVPRLRGAVRGPYRDTARVYCCIPRSVKKITVVMLSISYRFLSVLPSKPSISCSQPVFRWRHPCRECDLRAENPITSPLGLAGSVGDVEIRSVPLRIF